MPATQSECPHPRPPTAVALTRTVEPFRRRVVRAHALAVLLLAAVFPALVSPTGLVAAQDADPAGTLTVATAFNTAWNAHDLEAVMALLGEAPMVRQSSPVLAGYDQGTITVDAYGVAMPVNAAAVESAQAPIVLATGRAEVQGWIATLFAARHRVEVKGYYPAAGQVTWTYRAFADPYQELPGVGPTEGSVTASVQGGKITALVIAVDPASISRRQAAFSTAVADTSRRTGQIQPAAASRPSIQDRGTRDIGPWVVAAALSLASVILLTVAKRRPGA